MNKPHISFEGERNSLPCVRVAELGDFSVFKSFDCGQCFRFNAISDSELDCEVGGVALGKYVSFGMAGDELVITGSTAEDYRNIWEHYLALDEDYASLNGMIVGALDGDDRAVMERAVELSRGIRILRQEPWEALCSFIISQNNNIPRIKKIISSLCRTFGEKIGETDAYSFPTPDALAAAGEERLFELKTGFRAAYIADAARRVASGELELDALCALGDYEQAKAALMTVRGVGPKVADCTLLFGLGYMEAFPVDTWMKKVALRHFAGQLDHTRFGRAAGLAQQYLFYMERYTSSEA